MMHAALVAWNEAIRLPDPGLADLIAVTGWSKSERVFPHTDLLWMVGPNLLAQMSLDARPGDPHARVQRLSLILIADFFAPAALIQAEALPPFHILGCRVPTTAADLRDHLKRVGGRELIVYSEGDRVTLLHNRKTEFVFRPSHGDTVRSFDETRLVSIENLFRTSLGGSPAEVVP
jgi:hypothetical protein